MFCPLFVVVCVGQVFLSAGFEGWGDRHGRSPGYPQTWKETEGEQGMKNSNMGFRLIPWSDIVL